MNHDAYTVYIINMDVGNVTIVINLQISFSLHPLFSDDSVLSAGFV